jgi:phosphatidylinositol alpha-1,6-mannosyltransferase
MLRVLLLSPDFPPAVGGIQTLAHRLALNMPRCRIRVVTRAVEPTGAWDEGKELDVVRVGTGMSGPVANAFLNVRAVLEGLRFRPHAVLSGHIVGSPAAQVLARTLRVPVVQYVHADELRFRRRLGAFAVRTAAATVAVSRHTRGLVLGLGAAPERIRVIPNGVDFPERVPAARADRPTIVTVARLEQRYKGHDVLLRALPLVLERVPGVQWLVVGEGSLRQELERQASASALDGVVRFVGALDDRERDAALDSAHVFAMPSRLPAGGVGGEGFGIAYLEAAAHGLPVVAGNVGGAVDAVVHEETGLLVDPAEHVDVADALVRLLVDRDLAERLGRAGRERARRFSWPSVAAQVEALLLELAGDRGRAR